MKTLAPAADRCSAVALPMPLDPPVMMTFFPLRSVPVAIVATLPICVLFPPAGFQRWLFDKMGR
jgi:hypothetical protein